MTVVGWILSGRTGSKSWPNIQLVSLVWMRKQLSDGSNLRVVNKSTVMVGIAPKDYTAAVLTRTFPKSSFT